MTKEEAIKELEEMIKYEWGTYQTKTAKIYVKALEMAIKALEQEPCADTINRQAAIDLCERFGGSVPYSVLSDYDLLPPVNSQPKIGHWIDKEEKTAVCSCCNRYNSLYGNFCKWCGAKMESEE